MNEELEHPDSEPGLIAIGEKLFQWRDYTPLPLIVVLLLIAEPTATSATLGLFCIIFGELIRLYGVSFIGAVSRTRSHSVGQKLVTGGPFRYVRNPLYVGNFFLSTGISIYGGVGWFVLFAMAMTAFQYHCIVQFEEKLLGDIFGDEYKEYCTTVPRWLPKKMPSLDNIEWPRDVGIAFRSERKTFAAIAVMVLALMLLSKH